jgi:UPF0176 protein
MSFMSQNEGSPLFQVGCQSAYQIAAFYHFQSIAESELESLSTRLTDLGNELGLKGLIILAVEGMNGTVSGVSREAVVTYLTRASELLGFPVPTPKWSEAAEWPFKRFKVRLREEIVTLGKPEVQPLAPRSETHLSPEDWDQMLREEGVLVLDTRNWYEVEIGKFKGAVDPKLKEFHEFSDYLKQAEIPKDKKIMIYCTGGIRCEKAIVEMQNQGFGSVYQLDGGILNYLEKLPHREFEGECFVFDQRLAVDQDLKPSVRYVMCPHCGQPASDKIECLRCETETSVCTQCAHETHLHTCSKNCAYHYLRAPGEKGAKQLLGARFT